MISNYLFLKRSNFSTYLSRSHKNPITCFIRIVSYLGGRVSEELFLGEISTGASDDFKRISIPQNILCKTKNQRFYSSVSSLTFFLVLLPDLQNNH